MVAGLESSFSMSLAVEGISLVIFEKNGERRTREDDATCNDSMAVVVLWFLVVVEIGGVWSCAIKGDHNFTVPKSHAEPLYFIFGFLESD